MSIILVEQTDSDPIDAGSWTKLVETDKYYNLTINKAGKYDFSDDTVKQGVQIAIGGSNYLVDADEAITGTASDYVKITPSGSTATAEYVSDLTGVTWNSTYNFYEDTSGNAYIFNEIKALSTGALTEARTELGELYNQGYFNNLQIDNDLTVKNDLTVNNDLTVDNDFTFSERIFPSLNSTFGEQEITTTPWVIPRGVYVLSIENSNSSFEGLEIQMYSGFSWQTIAFSYNSASFPWCQSGMTIFSDGVNFRIRSSDGNKRSVNYRRF